MTHFVKLTTTYGEAVWVNPAHVASIQALSHPEYPTARSYVGFVEGGFRVTEAPERIAADLERAMLAVPPR